MNAKCDVCQKTAYPTEQIKFSNKVFHKACFKCSECSCSLNANTNAATLKGTLYCKVHLPVDRKATGGDSVATQNALKAPKPIASGVDWQSAGAKAAGADPNKSADIGHSDSAPQATDQGTEGYAEGGDGGDYSGGDAGQEQYEQQQEDE